VDVLETLGADSPEERALVDVVLDSATEPLVATLLALRTDRLVLEAPVDRSGRVVLPRDCEGGLLVWRGERDLQQAPVSVVATVRRPRPEVHLRLTGRHTACQRRSFLRADTETPVVLQLPDGPFPVPALDVSEGGLRCSTSRPPGLALGDVLQVEIELAGLLRSLTAQVVRLRPGNGGGPTDLGLRFSDLSIIEADRIRAFVFAELRRARATGRG
jgi:hypothetical protein